MDGFNRLQALTGDKNVVARQERPVQRSGVYEGTDSEEEEIDQTEGPVAHKNTAPNYDSSTIGNASKSPI